MKQLLKTRLFAEY